MKLYYCLMLLVAALANGCVSIPPLVKVEHHHDNGSSSLSRDNKDLNRRLEAMEDRLERMEKTLNEKK